MTTVVQARIPPKTRKALERLEKLGLSRSEVIREGIELIAARYSEPAIKRIVGVGEFNSGISDLGSHKKHLEDFGR